MIKAFNLSPQKRVPQKVSSEAKTRQKSAKRRSLYRINEYFEPIVNTVFASAVILRQPPKAMLGVIALACLLMLLVYLPTMLKPNTTVDDYIHCSPQKDNCISQQSPIGHLKLNITPSDLPYDQPLSITVISDNSDIQQLTLQLKGRDMSMGLLPVTLKESIPGQYSGTTGLSYCTLDNQMTWLAELQVGTFQSSYRLIFELTDEL